jgi:hypothetical protein
MKARTVLLPLICVLAGLSADLLAKPATPDIKTIKITDYDIGVEEMTYEFSADCDDMRMTEADVREFFSKARPVSEKERSRVSPSSRCVVAGVLTLSNGKKGNWFINKNGTGMIFYEDTSSEGRVEEARSQSFDCPTCRASGGKYYKKLPKAPATFGERPVLVDVTFAENGAFDASKKRGDSKIKLYGYTTAEESEDVCKQTFTLTEDDVRRFFHDGELTLYKIHSQARSRTCCYAKGQATLKDGRKLNWFINKAGYGELTFSDDFWGKDLLISIEQWQPTPR